MIYRIGSSGDDVAKIQKKLGIAADGQFGMKTAGMVTNFQFAHGLNADGVVGAITWSIMFGENLPLWYPEGIVLQREMATRFGDPHESSFNSSYIRFINLAEFKPDLGHIRAWNDYRGFGFEAHYLMEHPLKAALRALIQAGGAGDLHSYDGCHVVRNMRTTNSLSMHAYGMADDFNAATNPLNGKGDMSLRVRKAFAQAGFEYGGLWYKPHDPMHFQLAHTRDWRIDQSVPAELRPAVPVWK